MKKLNLFVLMAWGLTMTLLATEKSGPDDREALKSYEEYVGILEGGDTDINYTDFRNSYHATEKITSKINSERILKDQLNTHFENDSLQQALNTLKLLLDLDYTDIGTHLMLSGGYQKQGDMRNEQVHQEIAMGLLESILSSGDGKSPETAWKVIQVPEEYIVLRVLGATPIGQELIDSDPICDKISATINGRTYLFYFDVTKVMELYDR